MIKVLEEAAEIVRKKWPKGRGWKVAFIVGLIILGILGVVILSIWLLGRLVKGLTVGGFRNRDLYVPRIRGRV